MRLSGNALLARATRAPKTPVRPARGTSQRLLGCHAATVTSQQGSTRPAAKVVRTTPAAASSKLPVIEDTFGQAFASDALHELLEVPHHKRDRLFARLGGVLLRKHASEPVLFHTEDCGSAAIVLSSEQQQEASIWGLLSSGLPWTLLTSIPLLNIPILLGMYSEMGQLEEDIMRRERVDRYLKLVMIGTRPEAQGRGLGSALLRAISAEADAAGLPLYLEAATEAAAALYERYGYQTVGTMEVEGHAVPLMLRRPQAVAINSSSSSRS